jgi:hypothetical protein
MNIVSFQLNLMSFTPQEESISEGRKKLKKVYNRDPAHNQQGSRVSVSKTNIPFYFWMTKYQVNFFEVGHVHENIAKISPPNAVIQMINIMR